MTCLHEPCFSDAERAAWLLAVDPVGLGGWVLRGPADAAREQALQTLRCALPAGAPWRRLPAQIDDERLLGGLDLARSLAAGRPVAQAGLLAEVDDGILIAPMAERLPAALAAKLSAALDNGHVAARETAGVARPARFALVALDEGQDSDEGIAAGLLDRLALVVTTAVTNAPAEARAACWPEPSVVGTAQPFDLAAARHRLARLPLDEHCIEAFCSAAAALGLPSLRAPLQAWHAACAAAAIAGHETVEQDDAELAARLVIAPRARQLPAPPPSPDTPAEAPAEAADSAPPDSSPDAPQEASSDPADLPADTDRIEPPAEFSQSQAPSPEPPSTNEALEEQVLEAARAAIPPGLLALLSGSNLAARQGASQGGGRNHRQASAAEPAHHGRPLTSRRGSPGGHARLDVLQTLRAAVPWQRLRRGASTPTEGDAATDQAPRLIVRREDFHVRRFRRPRETTTIFAVDASGSQALHRLAEAKGAVELLLADCYVRRDRVALIAFRGDQAETLLLPTRSLVRAKRCLSALPGGGGTPLAAGLTAACALGQQVQARDGGRALLVFLTDARANIALDGTPGRSQAMDDALHAAWALRASGLTSLLIDTSPRPQSGAAALAKAMAARYVALPHSDASAVYAAVTAMA
jgi:magnesium chelatase subunit D